MLLRAAGRAAVLSRPVLRAKPSHALLARRTFLGGLGGDANKQVVATEDQQKALTKPIDFDVASKIEGQETQIVTVELEPNQILRAETGALLYMTDGVEIDTSTGGGVMAGLKRMATGQNFMVSDFRYTGESGSGLVALGTDFPSKIIRISLADYGGALIAQKGAFLAGTHDLGIEMEFTKKFTTGFFGGEGFVLQRIQGEGDAFLKAGGALIRRELREGETLRVTTGALVAFAPTVSYEVTMMKGFKNVVFGGEGLFLTTLTGPGTVFLQSMPFDRVVDQIAKRVPGGGGIALGVPLGMGGGGGEGGEGEGGAGGEDSEGSGGSNAATGAAMGASTMGSDSSDSGSSSGSTPNDASGSIWGEDSSSASSSQGAAEQQVPPEQPPQQQEEVWKEEGGGEEEEDEEGESNLESAAKSLWEMFK